MGARKALHHAPHYGSLRKAALILGPALFFVIAAVPAPEGLRDEAWKLAGLIAWMVTWWLSEAVPLQVTALLPIPMMPVLGIDNEKAVTACYAHPLIFLFMGGFLIATAMQRWGLHRRIALEIVSALGSSPSRIVGGFMLATALLSMWISNTATAIMMYAVGRSLLEFLKERGNNYTSIRDFGKALMLGIAFSASIGGVGTLIGTPPNALLAGFVQSSLGRQITFSRWMMIGVPFVLILLPVCWLLLTRVVYRLQTVTIQNADAAILNEKSALGAMATGERIVLWVFVLTALCWMTRSVLSGWTGISLSDSGIAMTAGIVLFIVPVSLEKGRFALDWDSASRLPWEVLLLFGGGLALAHGFTVSGLAEAIGSIVAGAQRVHPLVLIALVTVLVAMLTELTSNTATTATFLPIMGAVATGLALDPLLLCLPVALAASMAFMMPVATPPNAIVFACDDVSIRDMLRAGIFMNASAILLIIVFMYVAAPATIGLKLP